MHTRWEWKLETPWYSVPAKEKKNAWRKSVWTRKKAVIFPILPLFLSKYCTWWQQNTENPCLFSAISMQQRSFPIVPDEFSTCWEGAESVGLDEVWWKKGEVVDNNIALPFLLALRGEGSSLKGAVDISITCYLYSFLYFRAFVRRKKISVFHCLSLCESIKAPPYSILFYSILFYVCMCVCVYMYVCTYHDWLTDYPSFLLSSSSL